MATDTIFDTMNAYYLHSIPFFFIVSFDKKKGEVLPLHKLKENEIFFKTNDHQCLPKNIEIKEKIDWQYFPFSQKKYQHQFEKVQQEIQKGNTYLLNLTCDSKVQTNASLLDIFSYAQAPYKLYYKNEFVHFSPEPFVKIKKNKIASFPMKGTIDANLKNAAQIILNNKKELNEQFTIVDLIRNDLSMVAKNVRVEKFRYIEKIETNHKNLLTISSKITGDIRDEYCEKPGDIFYKLLPAGSISGAPKQKTLEIINQVETHYRNYYTGVWGIYDGTEIDSCVIIRYMEKRNEEYFYKSGGGITSESIFEKEYQELKDKIYVALH